MASPADNTSNCTYVWSKDTTEQLIKLYEEREVLYNITLKENHDRELRRRALQEIADELGMTEEEINRKVKSLRAQYGREKLRLTNCPDGGYQSKWHFLPMLTFLDKYMKVKVDMTTVKKEPNDDSCSMDEPEMEFSLNNGGLNDVTDNAKSPSPVQESPSLKRPFPFVSKANKRKAKTFAPIRFDRFGQRSSATSFSSSCRVQQGNLGSSTKEEDADDIFGKHVAAEIRSIDDPQAKRFAKLCIQNILFEAQSGIVSSTSMSARSPTSQPQFPSSASLDDRYSSLYQSSPASN